MGKIVMAAFVLAACGSSGSGSGASGSSGSSSVTAGSNGSSARSGSGSGSALPTGGPEFDEAITILEGYKAKMCACTDKACADAVFSDFKTWRVNLRAKLGTRRPTREQDQRGNLVDREMKSCRRKLDAGGSAGSATTQGLPIGSAATGGDPIERALVELEGCRGRMCACKDTDCSDKVANEYKAWKKNLKGSVAERPNTAQDERGNAIDKAMRECRQKLEGPSGIAKLDNFLAAMQGLKDKMCACKDKACGDAVDKERETLAGNVAKDLVGVKPRTEQDAKARAVNDATAACKAKLR